MLASFECPRFTGESWQAYGVEVVNCIGRKRTQSVDKGALDMRGASCGRDGDWMKTAAFCGERANVGCFALGVGQSMIVHRNDLGHGAVLGGDQLRLQHTEGIQKKRRGRRKQSTRRVKREEGWIVANDEKVPRRGSRGGAVCRFGEKT